MEKILIVGSDALAHHGISTGRKILDVDAICSAAALSKALERAQREGRVVREIQDTPGGQAIHFMERDGKKLIWDIMLTDSGEGDSAYQKSHLPLFEYAWDTADVRDCSDGLSVGYASLNVLYLMKMSHRFKKNSKHFLKTMDDIKLLRRAGAVIDNGPLYRARMAATYDYGHPKLNVGKNEFFKDDVPYKFDHDSIHEAVAVDATPAYTKYMADGEQVLTSRAKFEALDHRTKLLGVLEESYVLALERSIIPHNGPPASAFKMALSKVCTSITSGWFREFAWEHYDEVMAMYNPIFVDKFHQALVDGRIRPFKGSVY